MDSADVVLRFLRSAQAHGVAEAQLRCVQTHMSWLFFTPGEVLKLKKPVRTRYLDHSTLALRERDCREELRLNARLAPGVYLGLMALQRTPAGLCLVPDGAAQSSGGTTIDWLVRMRRLPEGARLDRRIACHDVDTPEIEALGALLARFYRDTPAVAETPLAYLAHFRAERRIDREVLLDTRWALPDAAEVLDRYDSALAEQAAALGARAAARRLVEGHGDLRAEHVFLVEPPVVIDALEFDARLRRVDPYDEVAFLGLECEMEGAPWIATSLHRQLVRTLGHEPAPALMRVYIASRALLRARLALGHLADEPPPREAQRWRALATRYLERTQRLWSGDGPHGWP